MIVSASRRTDIPAFYSEWFLNRLKDKYVFVRNPMNTKQISKISLDIKDVDFIVFWTKNPLKIMDKLNQIDNLGFQYYFQFTLNSFDKSFEPNVPKKTEIIDTFKKLADRIGPEKVIWRYDPIFFTDKNNYDYHVHWFNYLAEELQSYTQKCVISFLDLYKKTERNLKNLKYFSLNEEEISSLVQELLSALRNKDISLETCAFDKDLSEYNVKHASCIDSHLIEKITNSEINVLKDKSQRDECGCIESRDIGTYNTCGHLCKYCYANFNQQQVINNCNLHSPDSPLIFGNVNEGDKIVEVRSKSIFKPHTQNNWQEYLK